MKTRRFAFLCVLLGCCAWLVASPITRGQSGGTFVLVTHASNPITNMTVVELRKVFSGATKQWANGAVVVVGIIPSDAPETKYLSGLLETTPAELLRRMQEQVFRGELRRPQVLRSSADCFAFARSNPGALCAAAALTPPGVQTISVH